MAQQQQTEAIRPDDVIPGEEATQVLHEDVSQVISLGRRFRRWIAKHRKTITYAFLALGIAVFAVFYFTLLAQFLAAVFAINTIFFWTVIGVNVVSIALLILIFYRTSMQRIEAA